MQLAALDSILYGLGDGQAKQLDVGLELSLDPQLRQSVRLPADLELVLEEYQLQHFDDSVLFKFALVLG